MYLQYVLGSVILLSAVALLIFGVRLLLARRPAPIDPELSRRQHLSLTGRLTDGIVSDAQDFEEADWERTILIYSYVVGGVEYECSQDITHLRQFADLHSCRLGQPATIKYETNNPGDSIVLSEEWKGLRR